MAAPYIPTNDPVVMRESLTVTVPWLRFFTDFATLFSRVIAIPGINYGTFAEAPSGLTAADQGYLYGVTDYGHLVYWDGAAWQWAPGDPGNDYFGHFRAAPTQNGWQLCDGSTVNRLTVGGASLTETAVTVPNLTGTPSYLKAGAAYSGPAVTAATPPTITGQTATVGVSGGAGNMNIFGRTVSTTTLDVSVIDGTSTFDHLHDAGTLTAAQPESAHVTTLPYYRR